MESFIASSKLEAMLEEMKEASKKEFLLFQSDGHLIAGTCPATGFKKQVSFFAHSMADTQVVSDWLYFRLTHQGETEYVLLCSDDAQTNHSYAIGKMALCQLKHLIFDEQEPKNRLHDMRSMINGEITGEKMAEKCHQLRIPAGPFAVYVIQCRDDADTVLLEMLKHLFVDSHRDFMVEMDGTRTVLLKHVSEIPGEDYEQYARMIVDNVQAEAMQNVWVGYGDPIDSFEHLHKAYKNACTALKIGMVYYGSERAFYYEQLGIGRLIYKLPADLCEMFLKEVLGENIDVEFDEETMLTINRLFDNNLNISETARQLYIHRNTLVYRLERIEKRLGLDIRTFEDAMLFKIAMMVRVHLAELNVVN